MFLVGDFNARTGTQNDFIIDDVKLHDILNINEDLNDCKSCFFVLRENNMVERYNQDLGRINNYGMKLLDFCKRCNIFIANGRLFSDKGIGRSTCKGVSMVDYLLLSPDVLNIISEFEIVDFDQTFSDVHNRIHLTLQAQNRIQSSIPDTNIISRVKWKADTNKINQFVKNLQDDTQNILADINLALTQLTESTQVTHEQVNKVVIDLCTFIGNNATTVFGVNKTKRVFQTDNKPWFNKDCKEKRREFHEARNTYKANKTAEAKHTLNVKAKDYKKSLNQNFHEYQEKFVSELRTHSKHDTKAFWKT